MTISNFSKLIKANEKENVIDLKSIADTLGVQIKQDKGLADHCHIFLGEDSTVTIKLNASLANSMKKTYVAIALAEFLLTPERISAKGITYDMFFLKELYRERHSSRMLLATRLVLPETIIHDIIDGNIQPEIHAEKIGYEREFIKNVVKHDSALFLIENFSQ